MNKHNNGGPAFPLPLAGNTYDGKHLPQDGMTLRDYFAAKAMSAILCSPHASKRDASSESVCAELAYSYADAMLKARQA